MFERTRELDGFHRNFEDTVSNNHDQEPSSEFTEEKTEKSLVEGEYASVFAGSFFFEASKARGYV